jgi:hypothetical protein
MTRYVIHKASMTDGKIYIISVEKSEWKETNCEARHMKEHIATRHQRTGWEVWTESIWLRTGSSSEGL